MCTRARVACGTVPSVWVPQCKSDGDRRLLLQPRDLAGQSPAVKLFTDKQFVCLLHAKM